MAVTVPPPTRGWSRLADFSHRRQDHGFPRLRGDGPRRALSIAIRRAVPPPTRGWSPRVHWQRCARQAVPPPTRGWSLAEGCPGEGGSPAYAGMVPQGQRAGRSTVPPPTRGWSPLRLGMRHTWFPRLRGDGPPRRVHCRRPGSPAYAGMVPYRRNGRLRQRLPPPTRGWSLPAMRTRSIDRIGRQAAPPPTRGWSPVGLRRQ